MVFFKVFIDNLDVVTSPKLTNNIVRTQTITPNNVETFLHHLKIVISYCCQHPHSILEEIGNLNENGLDSIIQYLHRATQNNTRVWNGTIGEAIATFYILGSTEYKIPVFKLRFVPNRKMAMHGDDLLGMKFKADGTPEKLLVVEVKNYGRGPSQAVKNASNGLLKVQQGSITLLDFTINILNTSGKYEQARLVKQFLDTYNHHYKTEYLAFIVTEQSKWKNEHFDDVVDDIQSPLNINIFLIPNWIENQRKLVLEENKTPTKVSLPSVEINELEDVKKLLDNSIFKNEQNQLASEALTVDLKNNRRASIDYRYDPIKLEKAANFLGATGYNLLEDNPDEAEKVLKEAGVIHERLAILRLEDGQNSSAVDNIITSALFYSLAGYNANAKVLASKILRHQDIKDILQSDIPRILLSHLLNGEVNQIQDILARFFFVFANKELEDPEYGIEEEDWMYSIAEKISDIGDYLTAKAFAHFIHYLRTGDELHQLEISNLIACAGKQYATIGDYRSYVLLISIGNYFKSLIDNSTQKLIKSRLADIQDEWKLYLRFLSTLGKFPMMSMWKSQQKALQEGLLEDNKPLIIAMPTSAGKTKTVEIAIYQALKNKPDSICAYVVPTRALAYEVENSLSTSLSRVNISVSILYGGYDFSQLEKDIIQDNQVFVLTPEKLDLLTRSNEEFKNKLALIIIDEVHDSAEARPRSLRQELTYSRLLTVAEKNHARVIGISAVINNAGDFAKWLCDDENNVIKINWRPTKQRLGYLKWSLGKNQRATVQYLAQINDYPSDNFFIPLPFLKSQCWIKNRNCKNYRKNVVVAARLARYYTQTGSTLVFTTSKPLVEAISECLITLLTNQPLEISPEMQQISSELSELLGSEHLLVKAVNHGFVYHHAELPSTVKRSIENAVRGNIIRLIISTTTLSQGVNLPIKNVIVHSLSMDITITMSQYANAVGRAGRAGAETEGHIIFCDENDLKRVQKEESTEASESFIISGIRNLTQSRLLSLETTEEFLSLWAKSSTSQFRNNGENYENWTRQMQTRAEKSQQEILSYLDSQILAWILESCIDEVDEEKIEIIFKRLLCNIQSLDMQDILSKFKDALKARAISLKTRLPDIQQRKLFNITGLGVNGNELITEYAQKIVSQIEDYKNLSDLPKEFWQETYDVFNKITEIKKSLQLTNGIEPLLGWLHGDDYKKLADLYFEGKTETVVRKLEKVTYAVFNLP